MTTRPDPPAPLGAFGGFIARARAEKRLVVQPRMGFPDPRRMREASTP
ncbi:hypothetical protein [Streptomyces sudanensis]|nr:hypothetical protein [Streptomyces sudanensis]